MAISLAEVFKVVARGYCILHGWQGLPEHLPSDLDIVIASKDLPRLERALLRANGVRLVQVLQHEVSCFYFVLAVEKGDEIEFIAVDAATDYRRNGRVFFNAQELLTGRLLWNGFWVASPVVEFKYLLVKKVLKEGLPSHQKERLQELADALGERTEAIVKCLFGERWGAKVIKWISLGSLENLESHLKDLRRALLWQRVRQDPLNPLRYWLPEITRIIRRWRHPAGLFVAVLGPDGAGKSTLIERLGEELKGSFRRTAVFHFSPALLCRKGNRGSVTDPHGKPPRSWLASLLKLAYYWLDYTLGYWMKIRPMWVRSTLVLFDRYYDDLLIDPQRYRYGAPMAAARLIRRLIPRPDLFLVLDVRKERLLKRKQEVVHEELRRQVRAYRQFAANTPNAILLDGSASVERVVAQARDALLDHLHQRYLQRRRLWFPEEKDGDLAWLSEALGMEVRDGRSTHAFLRLPDGRGYLLPLHNERVFPRGLDLYPAQAGRARLARDALRTLSFIGLKGLGLPKIHLEGRDSEDSVLQTLREVFRREDLVLAVSLGTPGPHRKPVVEVMAHSGEVLGYAKVGWNEGTKALVRNETQVLQALHDQNMPFGIPQVLYANDQGSRSICVQGPPPLGARSAPRRLGEQYVEVLCTLAGKRHCRRPLEEADFWGRIVARARCVRNAYWQHMLNRALETARKRWQDREVPLHFAHGDFAPWNALEADGRLYLFDWEYAEEGAPAGYDLFHFLVQTSWLVGGRTPREIMESVMRRVSEPAVRRYWEDAGAAEDEIPQLFQLYLLDRVTFYCAAEPQAFDKLWTLLLLLRIQTLTKNYREEMKCRNP